MLLDRTTRPQISQEDINNNIGVVLSQLELPSFANTFEGGDGVALGGGEIIGNTTVEDGFLQSENFVSGSAGWQLTPTSAELNVSTAINSLDIPDTTTSNSFHVESDGDTFWGATPSDFTADNDNANAYVLKDGTAKFQNVTLDSTVVIGALSSGSLPAIQGWQYDGAFSVTDANTVAWAAGTLRFANGETRSISGSNTGNMTARTYIYYDEDTSTTAFQTTTTAATAVGTNKILVAVAEDGTSEATFQVFGGIGGGKWTGADIEDNSITASQITANTITASEISSNTITANELAANSVTATEINVSTLSAISANMGTLTAGSITGGSINASTLVSGTIDAASINLDASGGGDTEIRSGITSGDFANTGNNSGFIIGVDDSDGDTAKFYFGDGTAFIKWDGSTLTQEGATTDITKFGGDGSDGALSITSGTTTIDASAESDPTVVVRNYSSISITSTADVAFSNTESTGTIVILRSQGDVTLTASAPIIDCSGIGGAGGAGGAGSGSGDGNNGTAGTSAVNTVGASVGGGGAGTAGTSSADGTGGTASTGAGFLESVFPRNVRLVMGSGGGGGGSGRATSGDAGDGGNGGGALYIECAGDLNFTISNGLDCSGDDGTDGSSSNNKSGGGGGGGGGSGILLYNTATASSGTFDVSGGSGGSGPSGTSDFTGAGGAGGSNNNTGTDGVDGADDNAGDGGAGATGYSIIAENVFFA